MVNAIKHDQYLNQSWIILTTKNLSRKELKEKQSPETQGCKPIQYKN